MATVALAKIRKRHFKSWRAEAPEQEGEGTAEGQPQAPPEIRLERGVSGVVDEGLGGALFVLEGTDGSGRSTQIALLTEWLESQGFAVQTMGLRRSTLLAKDIDVLLGENTVTRLTLALMSRRTFSISSST